MVLGWRALGVTVAAGCCTIQHVVVRGSCNMLHPHRRSLPVDLPGVLSCFLPVFPLHRFSCRVTADAICQGFCDSDAAHNCQSFSR